jgi:hypothetical protein
MKVCICFYVYFTYNYIWPTCAGAGMVKMVGRTAAAAATVLPLLEGLQLRHALQRWVAGGLLVLT